MRLSKQILITFLCLTTMIVNGQSSNDEDAIKRAAENFSLSYVRGDYSGMANAYTEDAVLMSPGQDMIYGREAIYKFWSRDTSYHQTFHKSKSDKLEIVGNLAIDNGFWYSKATSNNKEGQLHSGKYLIIWKKNENGDWKMHQDIWNNRAQGWELEKP